MSTKKQVRKDDNDNLTKTHSVMTKQFQLEQLDFIIWYFELEIVNVKVLY